MIIHKKPRIDGTGFRGGSCTESLKAEQAKACAAAASAASLAIESKTDDPQSLVRWEPLPSNTPSVVQGDLCRTESGAAWQGGDGSGEVDGDSELWEMLPLDGEVQLPAGLNPPVAILPPEPERTKDKDFARGGIAHGRRREDGAFRKVRRSELEWKDRAVGSQDALLAGIQASDLSIAQSLAVVAGQAQSPGRIKSKSKAAVGADGEDLALVQSLAIVAHP